MALRERTRHRKATLATLAGMLAAAAGLLAACGQVLGIDGIDYDVSGEGGGAEADGSSRPDGNLMVLPDGAVIDDSAVAAADQSVEDSASVTILDAGARGDAPFTIAQGLGVPQALVVDDTRLYWVDSQGATGSIQSMPKDGSGAVATLAANQPSPLDINVDGTNVYWSVNQALPPAGQSQCLAMRAPKAGGTPVCATAGPFASIRMELSGAYLLVLGQAGTNDYMGYPAADGGYQNVQIQGPALAFTATAQTIFVGNKNGYHVDQLAIPALGFGAIVCSDDCGNSPIADITVDVSQANLLWVTQAAGVFTQPIASTAMVGTQIAQLPSAPHRMARDASYVYVTVTSSVLAVPIVTGTIAASDAGAAILTLASGETAPFGIAVDASYVYWSDGSGSIRAVSVPAPP